MVFGKIADRYLSAKELACPSCGKTGKLMQKTTVSKKKYRYKKWYVYHEEISISPKGSRRIQKWCYLNKNQLKNPFIQDKLKTMKHATHVDRYLLRSIRIRNPIILKILNAWKVRNYRVRNRKLGYKSTRVLKKRT